MTQTTRAIGVDSAFDDRVKRQVRQARTQTALVALLVAVVLFGIGFSVHNDQVSTREKRIADLEKETAEGRSGRDELLGEVPNIQSGFEKVKSEFGKLDEKAKSLKESSTSLTDDYTVWDEVVPQVQQSSQEVSAQVDALRGAIDELGGGVTKINKTRTDLTTGARAGAAVASPTPQKQQQEVTVYITNSGRKYHSAGCQYLSRSMIAINKSDAISRGYSACSKCNP